MARYDREEAWSLLNEFVKSESLIKHALAVESVMRHFAGLYGEDIEKWGVIGLIHDIDFEQYPDEHCAKAREILESRGWPEDYIHAVQSHGYKIVNDIEPTEKMERCSIPSTSSPDSSPLRRLCVPAGVSWIWRFPR